MFRAGIKAVLFFSVVKKQKKICANPLKNRRIPWNFLGIITEDHEALYAGENCVGCAGIHNGENMEGKGQSRRD